jgi:hypothetical protein
VLLVVISYIGTTTKTKILLAFVFLLSITTACSTQSLVMPLSCPPDNKKCQRNLDAQTLSLIGQEAAALQLMCMDSDLTDVLGDKCTK